MALFHFTVTQTKRSKGQSAIASAAYRSGEKLYSEYYGEYSDYTRKRGVICSDILLPPHAPKEYADRQTLWNAVEKAERGKNAQLAYSFEISLQNEFSLEENIALAREFLFREFVSRGMTVDVSFHEKECEDGGTPNPHFHFLCPIRPMEQDGTWGIKQRREYVLDEEGNRIRDANGKYVFNAVPTTDWGSPETLEHWREAWAEMCNAKFAEKGLDVRIDHRSYERQGVDLLPTIHEGATVRAMEKKGIRTEKGEFNRWIKATNAVIKDIRKKISLLFDWITEIKAELAKPQTPDLVSLLNDYYTQRKAGAYSQKGKISNLKEMNETYNYLRANGIYTLEDLESRLQSHRTTVDGLGSIDITAAVRSLLFIGKLKDSPTTRVLIHEKSSLAPPGQSIAFSLGDEKGFAWIGAYDITADELLAGTDTAKTESKTAQAQMLILELLADGKRMPSAELEKAVNERGISSRTMRTAKSRIGDRLVTEKDGTAWVCYLRD